MLSHHLKLVLLVSLVCLTYCAPSEPNQSCESNSDCNAPFDTCDMDEQVCVRKAVFPLEIIEYFGSLLLGVLIALCNAGGIGGGEIIVPIILIFFSFATKQAIALSNCCIFAGSLTRFIVNYRQKHPEKDAKSIDYSIVMVMLPMVLLGSSVGVQLNTMLPPIVLLVGMTLLIVIVAIKSIFNAVKIRKKELLNNAVQSEPSVSEVSPSSKARVRFDNEGGERSNQDSKSDEEAKSYDVEKGDYVKKIEDEEMREKVDKSNEEEKSDEDEKKDNEDEFNDDEERNRNREDSKPEIDDLENSTPVPIETNQTVNKLVVLRLNSCSVDAKSNEGSGDSRDETCDSSKKSIEHILKKEQRHCKPASVLMIPFLFLIVIFLSLLRGTSNLKSIVGIEMYSGGYFALFVTLILFCIVMTIINIVIVKYEYKLKIQNNYEFVDGDLKWETKLLINFLLCAFGAGVIAGTVGLGGGVIFNPLLQSFGVSPIVASATGMYMVMFSTLSSSILFSLAGYLEFGYALFLCCYIVAGTTIGLLIVNQYIKRTGKQSILAYLLAGIICLAAIVIPVYSVITLI